MRRQDVCPGEEGKTGNIHGNGFVTQEKKDALRFLHSTVLELLKVKTNFTHFVKANTGVSRPPNKVP